MFRFTIRDVLWLMLVLGLALALFLEREKHDQTRRLTANLESMFQVLAKRAASHTGWRITRTDTSLQISGPPGSTESLDVSQRTQFPRLSSLRAEWTRESVISSDEN